MERGGMSWNREAASQAVGKARDLGPMPVWNLDDLYPGPDCEAVQRDLAKASTEAKALQERWQGKLATAGGEQLAEAIGAYEALSDTLGRLGSYAGLLYAADTADPAYAKFYGDIQ